MWFPYSEPPKENNEPQTTHTLGKENPNDVFSEENSTTSYTESNSIIEDTPNYHPGQRYTPETEIDDTENDLTNDDTPIYHPGQHFTPEPEIDDIENDLTKEGTHTNIHTIPEQDIDDIQPNEPPSDVYVQESSDPEVLTMRYFYLYYTTADETEISSDRLVDLASFIGSVGGNLGLFLGFSFLGILFPLYEWAEKIYKNWLKKE